MSILGRRERRDYFGGPVGGIDQGYSSFVIPPNSAQPFGVSGPPVNLELAMRNWAVFTCSRLISDVVSTLPLDVLTNGIPQDTLPAKLQNPSAYATTLQWRYQVMMSLLLSGNAYAMIAALDRLGYPSQLDLLYPEHVTPRYENGKKLYQVQGQTLGTDKIWHLPGPQLPGEIAGASPVKYAARTIGLGLDAEQFGADYLRNGIHPSGVAKSDQKIDKEQADLIKQRAKDSARNRDLLVLGSGLDIAPWGITAEESQFLATLQHNAVAIAQLFGVPPEMIGIASPGSSVTYANREQRAQDFLNNAVNPWLVRLEEALSALFPRGTIVRFNTAGILKSDFLTRLQAYETGIQCGVMLRSEARALENWPPVPGIDNQPPPAPKPVVNVPPSPAQK